MKWTTLRAMKRGWLLVSVGLLLLMGLGRAQEDAYEHTEASLMRVLGAMTSALNFMDQEYDKLNLDAVIGIRVAEGQLNVLLRHLNDPGSQKLPGEVLSAIDSIKQMAGSISNRSIPAIKRGQADYYNRIGFIIQSGFWEQDYPSRDLDLHHVQRPTIIGEAMHESDSDHCLEQLRTDRKSTDYQCAVSKDCWDLMTSPGYRYYSLSHEIFYLLIGEATGCFKDMKNTINQLSAKFCASMLVETRIIAADGYPKNKQDLFMEDAALCGIYGFREFFNSDWLAKILSWQRSSRGCWGISQDEAERARKASRRTKREERLLPDGCECHRTAVALGALTQYVRYTIEYMQAIRGYDYF